MTAGLMTDYQLGWDDCSGHILIINVDY